jgi:hypothetical protein
MGVLISKPSEAIMAWIGGLAPADELAVRMALCKTNPWCQADDGWQRRIAALRAELVKSDAGEESYERRAAEIARDMDRALRSMMATPPDGQ